MDAQQVPSIIICIVDKDGSLAVVPIRRNADAGTQQGAWLTLTLDDRLDELALLLVVRIAVWRIEPIGSVVPPPFLRWLLALPHILTRMLLLRREVDLSPRVRVTLVEEEGSDSSPVRHNAAARDWRHNT